MGHQFGAEPVAVYDWDACIGILMERGMTRPEAIEFFDFNVLGSCMELGRMPVHVDVQHYREPPDLSFEDDPYAGDGFAALG